LQINVIKKPEKAIVINELLRKRQKTKLFKELSFGITELLLFSLKKQELMEKFGANVFTVHNILLNDWWMVTECCVGI